MAKKILLAGESWTSITTHIKGFDPFYTSVYETGDTWLTQALRDGGWEVDVIPNHLADAKFPFTMEELAQYDCVILSDIGSNTLQLPHQTFSQSVRMPNRCQLIKDYVLQGGGLIMVGGYMTFSGIDAKGRWGMTPVQDVLPVQVLTIDDRMEHCEGVVPEVVGEHEALAGIDGEWPFFLGYNKTVALEGSEVPVTICGDPMVAFCERGEGRSAIFASDCAPHWGPPEFVNWEHYGRLWNNLVNWVTKN